MFEIYNPDSDFCFKSALNVSGMIFDNGMSIELRPDASEIILDCDRVRHVFVSAFDRYDEAFCPPKEWHGFIVPETYALLKLTPDQLVTFLAWVASQPANGLEKLPYRPEARPWRWHLEFRSHCDTCEPGQCPESKEWEWFEDDPEWRPNLYYRNTEYRLSDGYYHTDSVRGMRPRKPRSGDIVYDSYGHEFLLP